MTDGDSPAATGARQERHPEAIAPATLPARPACGACGPREGKSDGSVCTTGYASWGLAQACSHANRAACDGGCRLLAHARSAPNRIAPSSRCFF